MLDEEYKENENTGDPLTHFLFGERARRNRPTEEENELERKDDWLFGGKNRNVHEADEWLLGGRSRATNERNDSASENENNILNNINLEELMGNIDTLMSSAHQLKPLLKKAGPLLEMFLKKQG
ncbi:hypothetical protein AF332_23225 [Sporosarcina globispora]|uniref:Uncharacterized protein n=1 Tax=Sporosarcina globispora TaxID=1459 RepID=A0A0M0GHY1_SPOGL|nr:hypothetical protein [Sporosarcina globispora]KON89439.1 hypothetical protein AF332_23225 [Sporosarcina globispora]